VHPLVERRPPQQQEKTEAICAPKIFAKNLGCPFGIRGLNPSRECATLAFDLARGGFVKLRKRLSQEKNKAC
jgi:hypothetical protein